MAYLSSYVIGIALGLGVAAFGRAVGFDRDRGFYPFVLVVTASYYVLFAILGGSMRVLIVESIVMSAFMLAAVIGFKRSLWLVVAGLLAHGTMDVFHASIVTNPGMPAWWPAFCLAFDLGAAAGFCVAHPTRAFVARRAKD